MRTKSTVVLLLAALGGAAGIAVAAPADQNPSDPHVVPPHRDSMHVTVTAGKGRLGIAAIQISSALRTHLGAPADRGVLIDAVRPDSPAARAGVRVGDVVVEVDGEPSRSASDMIEAMSDRKKGDAIAITVIRAGARTELRATLDMDPGPAWHGKAFGNIDGWKFDDFKMDGRDFGPRFEKWFEHGFRGPGADEMRRALDEARKRMERIERRLQKLERA